MKSHSPRRAERALTAKSCRARCAPSSGKFERMGANDPKAAWSALEFADLKYGAAVGRTSAEIAKLLGRPQVEVEKKAVEVGLKIASK